MKEFEAERLHALQPGHDGVLPGTTPLGGAGLELKVGQQVMGEHHELLPRAVGGCSTIGSTGTSGGQH